MCFQEEIDTFAKRLRKLSLLRCEGKSERTDDGDEVVLRQLNALAESMSHNCFRRLLQAHPELETLGSLSNGDNAAAHGIAAADAESATARRAEEERCAALEQEVETRREEERRLRMELRRAFQERCDEEEASHRQHLDTCSRGGDTAEQPSPLVEQLQEVVPQLQQRSVKIREALNDLECRTEAIKKVEAEQRRVESSSLAWLLQGGVVQDEVADEDGAEPWVIEHLRDYCGAAAAAAQEA